MEWSGGAGESVSRDYMSGSGSLKGTQGQGTRQTGVRRVALVWRRSKDRQTQYHDPLLALSPPRLGPPM